MLPLVREVNKQYGSPPPDSELLNYTQHATRPGDIPQDLGDYRCTRQ